MSNTPTDESINLTNKRVDNLQEQITHLTKMVGNIQEQISLTQKQIEVLTVLLAKPKK